MKILKGYVRNRARPEGCIAKRYIAEEYTLFCSKYIKEASNIGTQHGRNQEIQDDTLFGGRPIYVGKPLILTYDMLQIAHRYILFNCLEVQPYVE